MDSTHEINRDNKMAYLIVRLAMAVSMLAHGIVRLPKLAAFSSATVEQFNGSMLPEWLVKPMSYAIPLTELVLGITLFLGLFTRASGIGGALLMLVLMGGSG